MQFYLNFHHHIILVSSNEQQILTKLKEEFHYFIVDSAAHVNTTLNLDLSVPPELPSLVAKKVLETCLVYRQGSKQYIDYRGSALTVWDHQEETIRIYSLDKERLYELGFLAIHSTLGQNLDLKGLCRVHALGVSLNRVNALVMLPSKGGKSTLLSHLLNDPDIKIISDDMPLIDLTGRIHVFPSKISVETRPTEGFLSTLKWSEFRRAQYPPKWTAGLSQLGPRIETQSVHHKSILIAGFRLSNGPSKLDRISRIKMIPQIFEHMIVGIGLPQILEMFLRFNFTDVIKLAVHGTLRLICALQLIRKSKCFFFFMGTDREFNAKLLSSLMHDQQNS